MKCIVKKITTSVIAISLVFSLTACGGLDYQLPYTFEAAKTAFNIIFNANPDVTEGFATELCIVNEDIIPTKVNISESSAALLVSVNQSKALCAKNVHARIHPASTTKIMTALVALKYGRFDQILTASSAVNIADPEAKVLGLRPGDTMTMEQAMNVLLIYSGNDVANLIAENVAGSVEKFVELMNEEAQKLGATNTHFANTHGLTEDDHYTTAYDLYLLFNELIKHTELTDIIQKSHYETVYSHKSGKKEEVNISTTNLFLRGSYESPKNTYVIGGKTGTTDEAGHCIILYVKDEKASQYISIMMGNPTTDSLYTQMASILDLIN